MMRWLLYAVAGETELEFVLGDLDEEFLEIEQARGRRSAQRWFAWQVVRSVAPLLALRMRSGELTHALLAGVAGAAVPLWLCDRMWSYVYSQIPLKDGPGRTTAQFVVTLLALCVCAALAGASAKSREQAVAIAVSTTLLTAATLAAATGATPAVYVGLALLLAPLCATSGFWRKSR